MIGRQWHGGAAWVMLAAWAALLQGCAEKPAAPAASQTRVFASDLAGGAKQCEAPKPALADGKATQVAVQVVNDGGWCGITVQHNGGPYDAGLLTEAPAHGKVYIHPVGDFTRIDYTPEAGFAGADNFTVELLPGHATIRASVTVTKPGAAAAK